VLTKDAGEPYELVIEATLAADGDQTILVAGERACPWTCSPPTGPGCRSMSKISPPTSPGVSAPTPRRWDEFLPAYRDLAANVG
jgi:hypothetical protein